MPDENGTETKRTNAPSADDSLFGDSADDTPAAIVEEQDADKEGEQDGQDAGDAGEAGEAEAEATPSDELKVVVSMKGDRATIGVQQPSSDPHIESFDTNALSELGQEVAAVIERARAKWEDNPKHPAYERPAPPAKRRNNRRQQGAAQDAATESQEADTQQQTLRLF